MKKRIASFVRGLGRMNYPALFAAWLINAAAFALIYFLLDRVPGHGVIEPLLGMGVDMPIPWWDALYFSVVTGTTVGYGDFIPIGAAKLFAAVQSLVSFILLAATVSRIVSVRTEEAIREIHTLQREVHAVLVKKD